jgi:hypothetical protein
MFRHMLLSIEGYRMSAARLAFWEPRLRGRRYPPQPGGPPCKKTAGRFVDKLVALEGFGSLCFLVGEVGCLLRLV